MRPWAGAAVLSRRWVVPVLPSPAVFSHTGTDLDPAGTPGTTTPISRPLLLQGSLLSNISASQVLAALASPASHLCLRS